MFISVFLLFISFFTVLCCAIRMYFLCVSIYVLQDPYFAHSLVWNQPNLTAVNQAQSLKLKALGLGSLFLLGLVCCFTKKELTCCNCAYSITLVRNPLIPKDHIKVQHIHEGHDSWHNSFHSLSFCIKEQKNKNSNDASLQHPFGDALRHQRLTYTKT